MTEEQAKGRAAAIQATMNTPGWRWIVALGEELVARKVAAAIAAKRSDDILRKQGRAAGAQEYHQELMDSLHRDIQQFQS